MMEMEKNCNLLYKQELGMWIVDQTQCGTKFHTQDIDFLSRVRIRFRMIRRGTYSNPFLTSEIIRHDLQFNALERSSTVKIDLDRSKLEILYMIDRFKHGKITTFKLNETQQTLCSLEVSKEKEPKVVKKKLKKEPELDKLVGLVPGSLNGNCFLGYSKYGHLVLMNLETSTGSLIGRWPVDPDLVEKNLLIPRMIGAVSRDGSLVAVLGPTIEESSAIFENYPDYNMLRVYDTKSGQCHTRELPLPVIPLDYHHRIYPYCGSVLSFNPFNHNLLYFMAHITDGPLWNTEGDNNPLVLYDFKEDIILAARGEFLLTSYMGSTLGYKDVEGPVFLRHGEIIIVYHMDYGYEGSQCLCDYIGLLDAFSLDTVATVNLQSFEVEMCPLRYHFLISTCETEIVVVKRDLSTGHPEAHVYKIPDYDMSLKNLCRRTIQKATGYKEYNINELTMLPPKMRDYLSLERN